MIELAERLRDDVRAWLESSHPGLLKRKRPAVFTGKNTP